MKLAFSTLGCPEWGFGDTTAAAKDLEFDGVEVRGIAKEIYVPNIKAFDGAHIEKSKARLKEFGLEIPMLTGGMELGRENEDSLSQIKEYIDLAEKINTSFVRVMITNRPYPEEADMAKAIELYNEACKYGEAKGVMPLIETNGVLADTAEMKKFIENISSENKGVLWDIHHPYRYFNETPKLSYENIGRYVKYVHVKDSVMQGGKLIYRMMGYGDVPVYDCLKLLNDGGYDGYVTLEWVKRWNPDLESGGIVFAHYKNYMTFLLSTL